MFKKVPYSVVPSVSEASLALFCWTMARHPSLRSGRRRKRDPSLRSGRQKK